MGNSLLDQLKQAGIVDEARAKKVKRTKHQQKKQQQHHGKKGQSPAAKPESGISQKQLRDRELNRQRDAEAAARAQQAQINQLVSSNRVDISSGDIPFNFSDGTVLKRLYITEKVQQQLVQGRAAIVRDGEGYAVVIAVVADKVNQRDASQVVLYNPSGESSNETDSEDPYAEYVIPDDLMW